MEVVTVVEMEEEQAPFHHGIEFSAYRVSEA